MRERLPVKEKAADHREAVGKRIYAIRNRIVHTKAGSEDEDPLFPFDPEVAYLGHDIDLIVFLEAVMNSMRNGLGMRKTGDRRKPGQPDNPHSNAVFTQVHNTL